MIIFIKLCIIAGSIILSFIIGVVIVAIFNLSDGGSMITGHPLPACFAGITLPISFLLSTFPIFDECLITKIRNMKKIRRMNGADYLYWLVEADIIAAFRERYLSKPSKTAAQNLQKQQPNVVIKHALTTFRDLDGVDKYGAKGLHQYDEVNKKFDLLKDILNNKFDCGELTYDHFLASAQQVYLSVFDNLQDLVNCIKSIASIGDGYKTEMKRLLCLKCRSSAEQKQLDILAERADLNISQRRKADDSLILNERALIEIDHTIASLVNARIRDRRVSVGTEAAIKDLGDMVAQVHKYTTAV